MFFSVQPSAVEEFAVGPSPVLMAIRTRLWMINSAIRFVLSRCTDVDRHSVLDGEEHPGARCVYFSECFYRVLLFFSTFPTNIKVFSAQQHAEPASEKGRSSVSVEDARKRMKANVRTRLNHRLRRGASWHPVLPIIGLPLLGARLVNGYIILYFIINDSSFRVGEIILFGKFDIVQCQRLVDSRARNVSTGTIMNSK